MVRWKRCHLWRKRCGAARSTHDGYGAWLSCSPTASSNSIRNWRCVHRDTQQEAVKIGGELAMCSGMIMRDAGGTQWVPLRMLMVRVHTFWWSSSPGTLIGAGGPGSRRFRYCRNTRLSRATCSTPVMSSQVRRDDAVPEIAHVFRQFVRQLVFLVGSRLCDVSGLRCALVTCPPAAPGDALVAALRIMVEYRVFESSHLRQRG